MGRKHGRAGALRMLLLDYEEERNSPKPDQRRLNELRMSIRNLGGTVGFSPLSEVILVKDPRKVI